MNIEHCIASHDCYEPNDNRSIKESKDIRCGIYLPGKCHFGWPSNRNRNMNVLRGVFLGDAVRYRAQVTQRQRQPSSGPNIKLNSGINFNNKSKASFQPCADRSRIATGASYSLATMPFTWCKGGSVRDCSCQGEGRKKKY